jgi:CRP-like cAMP-binding protein
MFNTWSKNNLIKLMFAIEKQKLTRGDILFLKGEQADSFYILYQGRVVIRDEEKED